MSHNEGDIRLIPEVAVAAEIIRNMGEEERRAIIRKMEEERREIIRKMEEERRG